MAMVPERSKPLHNFSMPCLKWGNQRLLRCIKLTTQPSPPNHHPSSPSPPFQSNNQIHNSKRKTLSHNIDIDNNLNNINAVREKLMIDLRVAANNLKVSIFEDTVAAHDDNPRPWNLRTRRAACKAPKREEQKNHLDSPMKVIEAKEKENPKTVEKKQKKKNQINEKYKFSVSLSKEEVEQDFWALVGTKPPRRPKKKPKLVQRQLDTLFPGLWLNEVTAESYKVPDVPE